MRWSLKASETIGKGDMTRLEWVRQLEEEGHDTTGILEEEPILFPDLLPYWNAFHILSSSRNSGLSIGTIPLPAYESYFRIFGIDSLEERFNYIKFVGVLDSEFVSWQGEKNEQKRKRSERKNKTKGRMPPKRR